MFALSLWLLAKVYVEGVVATVQQSPVYWYEVQCRAKLEKVALQSPNDSQANAFIRKRVYDMLIVDYHKLRDDRETDQKGACATVNRESKLVEKWLLKQKTVWGTKSAESMRNLLEILERDYDVSWR